MTATPHVQPGEQDLPFTTVTRTVRFGTGPQWSSHQLALTAAHTLGVVVVLAAMAQASGGVPLVYWLLAIVAMTTMVFAGSGLTLGLLGLLLVGWFVNVPAGSFTWWSVPAAAGLLLSHLAVSLSATAPPTARFLPRQLRDRSRRGLLALTAAVVVAGGAAWLSGLALGPSPVAYGIGLAGVALFTWLARSNPPAPRD